MASEADETIINRIRKLMAYAGDGSASEGEIENALGHARRLMDKFNLSEADIVTDESKKASAYDSIKEHEGYSRANGIDRFDQMMAHVPCAICDVKFYLSERRVDGKDRQFIIFYGMPRDCAVAIAMYHELLATMRAMARFRYPHDWRKHFSSYCYGFVTRLIERANQLKRAAQKHNETTAIVLCKDALIERWKEENLCLGRASRRSARISNNAAYSAGVSDGNRVELGTNGIGSKAEARKQIQ